MMSAKEQDDGRTVITCNDCEATVDGFDFPDAAMKALRAGWNVPTDPTRPDHCPLHGGEGRLQFVGHARPDVIAHCPTPLGAA